MKTPSDFYRDSARSYHEAQHPSDYPLHDLTRTVASCGRIRLFGPRRIYLSTALRGQLVGLRELDDEPGWSSFAQLNLGTIDPAQSRFEPSDVTFSASSSEALTQANLLPMSPV